MCIVLIRNFNLGKKFSCLIIIVIYAKKIVSRLVYNVILIAFNYFTSTVSFFLLVNYTIIYFTLLSSYYFLLCICDNENQPITNKINLVKLLVSCLSK